MTQVLGSGSWGSPRKTSSGRVLTFAILRYCLSKTKPSRLKVAFPALVSFRPFVSFLFGVTDKT
jgi:hypothetical protein